MHVDRLIADLNAIQHTLDAAEAGQEKERVRKFAEAAISACRALTGLCDDPWLKSDIEKVREVIATHPDTIKQITEDERTWAEIPEAPDRKPLAETAYRDQYGKNW